MRTIQNVQAVGLYADEIRIVPKYEVPINLKRDDYYPIILENIERVKDVRLGVECRIVIEFETGAVCIIQKDKIYCGKNPS